MAKDRIPGMAVGIAVGGTAYVLNYGVASRETRRPVTRDTLFEIGSITKSFTATLTAYAQRRGYLSLSETTSKVLPQLRGTDFGNVRLLALATHTPGGLPLQVPDNVGNDEQLIAYLREWHPADAPGTYRTYSNVGIGTLGLIAARSMGGDFAALMGERVFSALGMTNSFIALPAAKAARYAQGYTGRDAPTRLATGELWPEAYGIRTSAADMIRFVEANMDEIALDPTLRQAIRDTHVGYFRTRAMTQDLIWEQYPFPVELATLLDGNSPASIYDPTPVTRIAPPQAPLRNAWLNKTGSTNGFGAYVAFVPAKRMGIVILANKSYAIADRVTTAHAILTALGVRH
ncbi:beta-lactamase [Vulcanimicrobium alpinum]|uniref:Beta-lactamase n=1 Tax=Vulcanimicrobium alpinum TaxID=3016050 RepID=A0AAN1XYG2_UNVUL|nr:class C beta-lactamase [Vulcanimicrobium alpinum]BDE07711.1 beta-lactamase [Vulcanimicrobium alpinum]